MAPTSSYLPSIPLMHYEYTDLAALFRRTYRALYMKETMFEAPTKGWPELVISLQTLDRSSFKDGRIHDWAAERARKSYVVVNYADFQVDHWALNFVEQDPDGTFIGRIYAN